MKTAEAAELACLDANVFLAILIPEATKASRQEVVGAERVLNAIDEGHLMGLSVSILFGEMRYVYLREEKPGFEIALAAIQANANVRIVDVTPSLAIQAAELRKKYYSKKTAFSYNDGLYLAVGLQERASLLITTDPHLLAVSEIKSIPPSQYR
jgi:predicted nucleic acid-binding protein